MLVKFADRLREGREEGSTLVSVLIIMLVLSLGGMTLAAIVTNTTGILVDARGSAQSRAAADAGIAEAVSQGQRGISICNMSLSSASAPRYSVTSSCGSGFVTISAVGHGQDGGITKTNAIYAVQVQTSTLDGALVSANGGLNVSSIFVTAIDIDGDVVLNQGSLDCNNSTEIRGDVIVRNGVINLSNYCHIWGDVIASGSVQIQNHVQIDGDVYAMGSFTQANSAKVGGNVYTRSTATISSGGIIAKNLVATGNVSIDGSTTRVGQSVSSGGTVSINAATVVGAVTAAGTGDSSFYGAKVGAIRVAGKVDNLQSATVTGNVISTRAGVNQQIAPDVTIGGNLTLAGTYSTWSSGPTVAGTKTQNVTGLVAPTAPVVATPWQLDTNAFQWSDLPFNAAAWGGSGFSVIPTPGCNFQNNPGFTTQINARTAPTIVDARACSQLKLYSVTFSLKTDIVFLVSSLDGQFMKINSDDGADHLFSVITPDSTLNHLPTCVADPGFPAPGTLGLSDVLMSTKITGVAYSPCTVQLGQSGGNASGWNGQVYAGTVAWGGNSGSRMELAYREVNIPGLVIAGAGGSGPTATSGLGALISLRDVP